MFSRSYSKIQEIKPHFLSNTCLCNWCFFQYVIHYIIFRRILNKRKFTEAEKNLVKEMKRIGSNFMFGSDIYNAESLKNSRFDVRNGSKSPVTSKMELFATLVKGFKLLSIVSKSSALYASGFLGLLLNLIVTSSHQEMI